MNSSGGAAPAAGPRCRRAHRLRRAPARDALAEGAVADLVVVLQEATKAVGGSPALGSPRARRRGRRRLALVGEALGQAAPEVAGGSSA
jgi:hypothetical protein